MEKHSSRRYDNGDRHRHIVGQNCRGRKNGGKISLVHVAKEESGGLRKGAVIDVVEVSRTINRALAEVKKISKAAAKNIYLSIGTAQVKMQMSRGIVAVSRADAEIYQDDIDRAVRASQAVNLPQNRMIIHTLTREFVRGRRR